MKQTPWSDVQNAASGLLRPPVINPASGLLRPPVINPASGLLRPPVINPASGLLRPPVINPASGLLRPPVINPASGLLRPPVIARENVSIRCINVLTSGGDSIVRCDLSLSYTLPCCSMPSHSDGDREITRPRP